MTCPPHPNDPALTHRVSYVTSAIGTAELKGKVAPGVDEVPRHEYVSCT